jgi:hypothetical protein
MTVKMVDVSHDEEDYTDRCQRMGDNRIFKVHAESECNKYHFPWGGLVILSTPRADLIKSDTGFSVEVIGRSCVRYCQDDRSLNIECEPAVEPTGLIIYPGSIRSWSPPYADDPIDSETKASIVENVRAAFRFAGFEIDVL